MPKETFINLPEAKKDKITNAILKEFARESFNKASISNIIKEAEIPRGSFYQYFEDKEDAIRYIIDSFLENEQKELLGFLVESKGDIFETSLRLFERLVEKSEEKEKLKLYKNITLKIEVFFKIYCLIKECFRVYSCTKIWGKFC